MPRIAFGTIGLALSVGLASAQSASLNLQANPSQASPGDLVTITLVAEFDATGLGIFGDAGLFGFGGDIIASEGEALSPELNPSLTFGSTLGQISGGGINRIGAGTGLDPALTGGSVELMSYSLRVPDEAADEITVGYEGAVILDANGRLVTFSTDPGPNQNTLPVTPVTIATAGGPCAPVDIATTNGAFGTIDGNDIAAFVQAFLAADPAADVNTDGAVNGNDIALFVQGFLAGCP